VLRTLEKGLLLIDFPLFVAQTFIRKKGKILLTNNENAKAIEID
jgi:hypothetical protein